MDAYAVGAKRRCCADPCESVGPLTFGSHGRAASACAGRREFQSITEYNGAAMVAMVGKNCVAIAADLRLGVRGQTVAMNFQKVFPMGDKLYLGLAGLATDVQTL